MDQENSKKVLLIGVGNLLLGDEGIGIHFIQEMRKELLPRNVKLVDGGTAGIELLYWLEEADYAIIVDCVEAGVGAGTILRVPTDELLLESTGQIISLHDINLSEVLLLATKMNTLPPAIIFGVQPEFIGYQTELSPTLHNTLPRLIELIKKEIFRILA